MPWWQVLLIGLSLTVVVYAAFVLALIVARRRSAARAVATFVPDCVILFRRLLGDPRVPLRHKLVVGALIPYLLMPFDLVPDFIPVAGYLDDAVIVEVVLDPLARPLERTARAAPVRRVLLDLAAAEPLALGRRGTVPVADPEHLPRSAPRACRLGLHHGLRVTPGP
jgi:uncharacterized membrane protein YkvA (DUF1232 family)